MALLRQVSRRHRSWGLPLAMGVPAVAAVLSMGIAEVVPGVSALMWGLVAGALVANVVPGIAALGAWAATSKVMLRLGIVLLGLQLSLGTVAELGAEGLIVISATVALTFAVTKWVGRRLGLEQDLVTLIATGFSICGAAAVAAVQDSINAKQKDVGAAVALVTLFGTAALFFVPWAASGLSLGDERAAVWAGASIHEVAQVVAASSLIGSTAYPIASAVKLGRVVLLAPIAAFVGRNHSTAKVLVVPWFVIGFMVACLVGSSGVLPSELAALGVRSATGLLSAGMFGLGLGLTIRDLVSIPRAAVGLAAVATSIVLLVPLALIYLLL